MILNWFELTRFYKSVRLKDDPRWNLAPWIKHVAPLIECNVYSNAI